jgi:hypothetical protein
MSSQASLKFIANASEAMKEIVNGMDHRSMKGSTLDSFQNDQQDGSGISTDWRITMLDKEPKKKINLCCTQSISKLSDHSKVKFPGSIVIEEDTMSANA